VRGISLPLISGWRSRVGNFISVKDRDGEWRTAIPLSYKVALRIELGLFSQSNFPIRCCACAIVECPLLFNTMKFSFFASLLATTSVVAASVASVGPRKQADHISARPKIDYSPERPSTAPPSPKQRCKTCFVDSHGDGVTDDSEYILEAFHKCNNGGHVVFRQGVTYLIGTAMDWTFLNSIDIGE
jgi:hypothetical protein